MSNGEENSSAQIQTPIGSVQFNGKKTAEFISILSLCALFVLAYVLWDHQTDSKANAQVVQHYLKQNVESQRMMNCLLSLPQEERYKEYRSPNSFCKSISQER